MADESKPKKDRLKYFKQMRENYRVAKEERPRLGWILLGIFFSIFAVFVLIGVLLDNWLTFVLLGFPVALLPTTWFFSRTAMRAAYARVEDQPGGAAAVASAMRGKSWSVTPAVAVTRNQDLVHRAVGRPGVVLISEGPTSRVQHMLISEAKRTARYLPDVPIHQIQVGGEDGQVPVDKLQKTLTKLPEALTPAEVNVVRRRLDALKAPMAGIPKGPIPKSAKAAKKGQRPR